MSTISETTYPKAQQALVLIRQHHPDNQEAIAAAEYVVAGLREMLEAEGVE